jgi:hypothetical protein
MLRRLATASRKLVLEAIVLFVLIVEVNVRVVGVVRRGSLKGVDRVKRGEINGFCM